MTRTVLAPLLLLLGGCAAPEPAAPSPTPPAPPPLATTVALPGLPNARQVEGLIFGGQPTAAALEQLAAQGVRTVINLRDDPQTDVDYDEAALLAELGVTYVHVPIDGKAFTAADAAAFSLALDRAQGQVLIHCKSGNRVGALWAVHLVSHDRVSPDRALEHGEAAGLAKPPTRARTEAVVREVSGS